MKAERFAVTPATIAAGKRATVEIELDKAPPGLALSVEWFGDDGWIAAEQQLVAGASRVTAPAPAFARAGTYRATLRAGLDDLAQAALTVTP